MDELSGTKERIFDTFIEMVSVLGYENVTIREIAKSIDINAASIYYHYESKERILEHIYEYYSHHYFDTRIPVESMKTLVETANPEEFIFAIARNYVSDDEKKHMRMILITKIIYMRLFQDNTANTMFREHNANDYQYVSEILQHGIDVGRIQPDFDLEIFARVITGAMMAMGIEAFANPDYSVGLLDHEARVRSMLGRLFDSALL
ncbi:MAG: TetR/AcrR family transcriptional regulator [Oscillospiraceae bacterium]|nr:TetR/AcrR family transcriptional regulator [Oscillospiraceae bacterium]